MVLSELRRKDRNPGVTQWFSGKTDKELFVSVISIGEIARGIAQQDKRNEEFARRLKQWLEKLLLLYGQRVLLVDIHIAKRWGELSVQAHNAGVDILLAATAMEHNLTIVTRNERHFSRTGVGIINPWK
ncbi:MAG: type II toxin-antitoxin system VapC family toxin [Desulfovibrionaceae bacterium]|nr:type II toxin-antitoxin system VapC family toxin [Desulfovibrionaceae bacterium]